MFVGASCESGSCDLVIPRCWKLVPEVHPGNALCKEICITYSFIVQSPNIVGNFLLFVGQESSGPTGRELPNIFPFWGVPEYFR